MEDFAVLAEFPTYEISRAGVVRRVRDGRVVAVQTDRLGARWVQLSRRSRRHARTLAVLLVETFGRGAASAAGLNEPDMRRARRARKTRRELPCPNSR